MALHLLLMRIILILDILDSSFQSINFFFEFFDFLVFFLKGFMILLQFFIILR